MKNPPKLEGIVNGSVEGFFVVNINGKNYPFSKYTSRRFVRPIHNITVNCYFSDSNKTYIEKVESEKERILYLLKD
jgi:hypothetical protein